jgi:hypothetical protein
MQPDFHHYVGGIKLHTPSAFAISKMVYDQTITHVTTITQKTIKTILHHFVNFGNHIYICKHKVSYLIPVSYDNSSRTDRT